MKKSVPNEREYKHRETLQFRGLTYRYDKTFGEWHLVEKKTAVRAPRVIFATRDLWRAEGGLEEATPTDALEQWLASLIDLRTREAREAEQTAKDLKAEVQDLKRRTWKA